MDPFEYVVVLTSLILGLGIAQILSGIADILSNIRNVELCLPHSVFVLVVFILHIQEWWINYEYASEVQTWTLITVLSILNYPILIFIMARMLFPTGIRSHEANLREYYYDQWPYLFVIATITTFSSILQNVLFSGISLMNQLPHLAFMATFGLFLIFKVNNHKLHTIFQLLCLTAWILYILLDTSSLTYYQ